MLDRSDVPVETLAHDVFECESFHDADTLQGFLQRLDDAGAAMKLVPRDRINAPYQLAQKEESRRGDHKGEERHQRVLHHHDKDQADQ
jgi:hypothetical protein